MARALTLTPVSCTLAKTLNPIFALHNTLPFSSSILSRPKLTRRNFSSSVLRSSVGELSGGVDDDGDEEAEELDELDLIALEEEAKDVVEAYSSSLSQILSIGESSFQILFLLVSAFGLQ